MGIIIRSDEEILELIKCEKRILKRPPGPKESNRDFKRKFKVLSSSSQNSLEFDVFFAQNKRLPSDFSLGLMSDKYLLVRYNGFHGTTKAGYHRFGHHATLHSHILTLDDINMGKESYPSHGEDMTGKYFDFESAQLFFLQECGIINYRDYFDFPNFDQISFSDLAPL